MRYLFFILFVLHASLVKGAEVFVQTSNPSSLTRDPVFAEYFIPGGPDGGRADLSAGQFRALATATNGVGQSVYSGFFTALELTSVSANPIVFAPSLSLSGTFSFGSAPSTFGGGAAQIGFFVETPTFRSSAASYHTVGVNYDANGNLTSAPISTFTDTVNGNGATYNINNATLNAFDIDIQMPLITLDPSEKMTLSVSLATHASGYSAITDFFTQGAQLAILLPQGAAVITNAGVATPWIVPIPAAAWMFGSGLIFLAGSLKRKRAFFS